MCKIEKVGFSCKINRKFRRTDVNALRALVLRDVNITAQDTQNPHPGMQKNK